MPPTILMPNWYSFSSPPSWPSSSHLLIQVFPEHLGNKHGGTGPEAKTMTRVPRPEILLWGARHSHELQSSECPPWMARWAAYGLRIEGAVRCLKIELYQRLV